MIKTLYHFTVIGKMGWFPKDMLRYDQCGPATDEDVEKIKLKVPRDKETRRKGFRVNLIGSIPPTADRWKSFLWRVDPDSIKTEKIKGDW